MASIEKYWYEPNPVSVLLLPLAWLFCLVVILRRFFYRASILKPEKLPVPVIVVGNITVGGTGKTPLVVAIVEHLSHQGFKPGVVSRPRIISRLKFRKYSRYYMKDVCEVRVYWKIDTCSLFLWLHHKNWKTYLVK